MASFKFCPSCGVETDGTKFCVECGADLRREAYGPAAVEASPKKKGSEKGQASGPASGAEPVPEGVPEGKSEAKKSISDVSPIRVAPVAEGAGGADADGTAGVGGWTRKRKVAGGCVAGVIVIVIGVATVVLASGSSDGSGQVGSKTTAGAAGGPCLTIDCAEPTSPATPEADCAISVRGKHGRCPSSEERAAIADSAGSRITASCMMIEVSEFNPTWALWESTNASGCAAGDGWVAVNLRGGRWETIVEGSAERATCGDEVLNQIQPRVAIDLGVGCLQRDGSE